MAGTSGERRIVSVLVLDVAESTSIAETLGPERSKFLFDEVVALMREEVERFGGTVAQLTGDGVLALFGAPFAHEDDSERAVRSALAIRGAVDRYSEEIRRAYGIELRVRAAVNTGPVVVPEASAPPQLLYNALGDTVNVASRLQAFGDLVVGSETARQIEDRFVLEPLGELELKGKSLPTAAFQVTAEREARTEEELPTRFVGRVAELTVLEDVLDELVDGRGAVLVVSGEPGIGKSRLKSQARDRFVDRIRFLEGHAVSYGAEIPYWPFRELLRDWLGLGVSDVEARVRLELRTNLARVLGPDADDAYPFLGALLGLSMEAEVERRLRELSHDSVQQQTYDAFYRLVCALSHEIPLCLVLEDLHWADEATTEMLEHLLPATDEAVAILLSFRPEGEHLALDLRDRARRRFRHRFVELELSPLPVAAAQELAVASARAELPDEVTAVLVERSGGNPFFLEEALRDLVERGVLRRRNGNFELAGGAEPAIPVLVQEALQARLDRLPQPTRDVLTTAAVIGRSFGLPLLERLVPAADLRSALSELQRLGLIVEERRRPTPEYRFRHGLVQEVAYRRLVGARHRALHLAVAEAVEKLHGGSVEEVYGVLARHYSEADEPRRAAHYLLRAGDAARTLGAEQEALDLYDRALVFLERTEDDETAHETLLKMALTQHLAFRFEDASDTYSRAFARRVPELRLEPTEVVSTAVILGERIFVPGLAYDEVSWELCRNLFRGLLAIGRDYVIRPDLAEGMEIGDGGRHYRFRLRPDGAWSDGTPVTAADFAYTWTQMRKEPVLTAFLLDDLAEVEATGELTLEIQLREPRNYFLYLVAQPAFFAWPRHVHEKSGPNWHQAVPLIGNGPFVLSEQRDDELLLTASPTWRGPRGNVERVRFIYANDPADAAERWREGGVELLEHFHSKTSPEDSPSTVFFSPPQISAFYLGFNATRPPFDDVRVRRAVAHAVDREALLEQSDLRYDPSGAGGFIPPTLPAHSHRIAPPLDPDQGKQLLADAGKTGRSAIPPITIVAPTAFGSLDVLAEQLSLIGISATIRRVPYAEMMNAVETADAFVWGWNADYPDPAGMMNGILEIFAQAKEFDVVRRLLSEARSLRNRDERLRLYREADRLLVADQVGLVPLAYGRDANFIRPWIQGFWANSVSAATYAEIVVDRQAGT
ncbi:MAG TPA: ABC transporter substrate-binding protein [Gaiellaceae bacterium]|nr:ABC transporter substrate-binding protein [Gaiellaceae bacterium]